jgi:hypothetical protein
MELPKISVAGVITGIILFFAIMALLVLINPRGIQTTETSFRVTEQQAILDDARIKYPDADIVDIINVTEVGSGASKYYDVKVRVTELYNSTCPKRYHLEYFYPNQKFEPSTPELVTRDCSLCANGNCLIAFEEEAIIASLNAPGTEGVKYFVVTNKAAPSVSINGDEWRVLWYSQNASVRVSIMSNGYVKNVTYS